MPLAPTISSVSATSGVAGEEVTFRGTNLAGVTRVYFGSGNTTGITVIDDFQIKVVIPATATSAKPILQSNEGRATSATTFNITGAPTIASFEPEAGPVGTTVTIKGANLTGTTRVYFGSGVTTVFTVNEVGDVIVDVPPTATTGAVKVQSNNGQASKSTFTVSGAPVITEISPLEGEAGVTTLTIRGENIKDAIRVYVGGSSTTDITVVDDNTITILVPAAAYSTGTVRVLTAGGQGSSSQTFKLDATLPVIDGFEPTSATVNTVVTITGKNFGNATSVSFAGGTTSTFISKTDTEIKVAVPKTAYSGAITVVSTTGRKASTLLFTVEGAPIVNSFYPEAGDVSSQVTVVGSNFTNATRVYIGSGYVDRKDFIYGGADNVIIINVPTLASTGAIRVVTDDGQVTTAGIYTVTSAPVITSFDPGAGYIGSPLKIYGYNFTGATRVYVGSGSITSSGFTVNSAGTEITLLVPASATTGTLKVQTAGGQFASTGTYVVLNANITVTPSTINFKDVAANSEVVEEYIVSGDGLTNGTPVSIDVTDPNNVYSISLSREGTYSRFLALRNVVNNKLAPTTIYLKYLPTTKTEDGVQHTGSIVHTQGSASSTLTINGNSIGPQPVELTSFTAKTKGKAVLLEWRTATETDNSHFDVEVAEGTMGNFMKVASVKSKAGNSAVALNYNYTHRYNGNETTLYYRLKQVDVDGTFEYSKVVSVELNATQQPMQLLVAPNPLSRDSKLILTSNVSEKAALKLHAIDGKQVISTGVVILKGYNEISLPFYDKLQSGMYILTVELEGKVQQVKVFKR
ncbi:IPT/TIG domain-containing protein [uncultured Pontibacter sp.]|uniref:IPT/TIG domain-containing protein n=1 Tax=uncultured Pontibacter sp. TaxID=453356 RepID=UPI0026054F09|nr:IPT/TIG domain-containing protein [uncultured Pontibacter sp.]